MTLAIILVEPQRPANVGAAARAMRNFGLDDLRLVGGARVLPGEEEHAEARALAWNAAGVLEGARRHATLADAVADLHVVAATSSRSLEGEEPITPRAFAADLAAAGPGVRAGCVFGGEASGLTNAHLGSSTVRVRIPARAEQPSLNLAQAVLVVAYEVASASPGGEATPAVAPHALAEVAQVDRLCAALQDLALGAGYLNPQAPEHVMGELRRLLARARPTPREITLLQGLVAQLRWAQDHAPRA